MAAWSPFHSAGRYVGPHRHLSASCFPKATKAANESLSLFFRLQFSYKSSRNPLFADCIPAPPAASASASRPNRPVEAWYRTAATLDATWVGVKEVRRKSPRHSAISRPIRREPARNSKRSTKNWSNAKHTPEFPAQKTNYSKSGRWLGRRRRGIKQKQMRAERLGIINSV